MCFCLAVSMDRIIEAWLILTLIVHCTSTELKEIRVGFVSDEPIFLSMVDGLASLELAVGELKEDRVVPEDVEFK